MSSDDELDASDSQDVGVPADELDELNSAWHRLSPDDRDLLAKLTKESARGIILIVSAYAEQAIESLFRAACVKDGKVSDSLLSVAGPLGTHSARIAACWCLGLLPAAEYNNLEQLRKLRNHCAHNLETVSFSDQKVIAHIRNLIADDPRLEIDKPEELEQVLIGRLCFTIAAIRSWVRFAAPLIRAHLLPRVLAYAAKEAVEASSAHANAEAAAMRALVKFKPE